MNRLSTFLYDFFSLCKSVSGKKYTLSTGNFDAVFKSTSHGPGQYFEVRIKQIPSTCHKMMTIGRKRQNLQVKSAPPPPNQQCEWYIKVKTHIT